MEYKKGLIFILIALNIFISIYLIYTSYSNSNYACLSGTGCEEVAKSKYSVIFEVPLSLIGTTCFIALFLIYLLVYAEAINKNYFLGACILGSIFSAYFIYLQFFVINALCSNCLIVDTIMFIITIVAFYTYARR